jgi:hypothetical protein
MKGLTMTISQSKHVALASPVNICCVILYLIIHNLSNQHDGMESVKKDTYKDVVQ